MAIIGPVSDPSLAKLNESLGKNNLSEADSDDVLSLSESDYTTINGPESDTSPPISAVFQDAFRDSIEQASTPTPEAPQHSDVARSQKIDAKLEALFSRQTFPPEQKSKITEFISAFNAKNGEFYTELALNYLLANPKRTLKFSNDTRSRLHSLVEKDISRQDKAKQKLARKLISELDSKSGRETRSMRNQGLTTWYDTEVAQRVADMGRFTTKAANELRTDVMATLLPQIRETGIFISNQHRNEAANLGAKSFKVPEGVLNEATKLREIDLTEAKNVTQLLGAVAVRVETPEQGPESTSALQAQNFSDAKQELLFQLNHAQTAATPEEEAVAAAHALRALNNLLIIDNGAFLQPTDRENLTLFQSRLKEIALTGIVDAFKAQLKHELEYLEEPGSKREVYISGRIGLGSKKVPALGALGISVGLKLKLELRNNDYVIREYKAFTNSVGLNGGKEGGLFNFKGHLSRTQAYRKEWKSIDDFVDHHSNDVLANVVNLDIKNVSRIFSRKSERAAASELKTFHETRAGDLQKLNGRLQALDLIDYTTTTIKEGERIELPRYVRAKEFQYEAGAEGEFGFGAAGVGGNVEHRVTAKEVLRPWLVAIEENPALLDKQPSSFFDVHLPTSTNSVDKPGEQVSPDSQAFLAYFGLSNDKPDGQTLNSRDLLNDYNQSLEKLRADSEVPSETPLTPEQQQQYLESLHKYYGSRIQRALGNELQSLKNFESLVHRANTSTDSWIAQLSNQGVSDLLTARGAQLGTHDYLRAVMHSVAALKIAAENLPDGEQKNTIQGLIVELSNRAETANLYLDQEEYRQAHFYQDSRLTHRTMGKAEVKLALPLVNIGRVGIGVTAEARWNENPLRDGRYMDIDITLPSLAQIPAAWDGVFTQLAEHGLVEHNLTGILHGDFVELLGHGEEASKVAEGSEATKAASGAKTGIETGIPIMPKFKADIDLTLKLSYQFIDGKPRLLYSHLATDRSYELGLEAEVPLGHSPLVVTGGIDVGKESTVPIKFRYGTGTTAFLAGQYYYWKDGDTPQNGLLSRQWHEVLEHHPNNLTSLMANAATEGHQVRAELLNMISSAEENNQLTPERAEMFREKLNALSRLIPAGKKRADISESNFTEGAGILREFLELNTQTMRVIAANQELAHLRNKSIDDTTL